MSNLGAHVHVIGAGCEAVFNLCGLQESPELRENYGFSRTAVNRIQAVLVDNLTALCREWENIHGRQ
jgi:hypothetical protein